MSSSLAKERRAGGGSALVTTTYMAIRRCVALSQFPVGRTRLKRLALFNGNSPSNSGQWCWAIATAGPSNRSLESGQLTYLGKETQGLHPKGAWQLCTLDPIAGGKTFGATEELTVTCSLALSQPGSKSDHLLGPKTCHVGKLQRSHG